ncbi:uncharacterized protein [Solanum lycopersicum]|uniref:uncharacterized protein n=1 Tax=Solanum lycopersicum TaxID=4081 RepID=UPI003749886E
MAPYEALYGRRCRSPIGWFEMGEPSLHCPDLVYKTLEKVHIIRIPLQTAYSRQKSNADHRRRDSEFEEGDKAYLKISPMKGVVRLGKKGKLSPRYVGPYEILQRVCKVTYELQLPSELASVHLLFHVSMLKKCIGDHESFHPIKGLGVKYNLSYEEFPIQILDSQVEKLRNKEVASLKVLWKNHLVEGATSEAEVDMKYCCPHLFEN